MQTLGATGVVEDRRFFEHAGPEGHPERPQRLEAVRAAIAERVDELTPVAARMASDDELLRVHGRAHLGLLEAACAEAPTRLDADTFVSERSAIIARLAAGAAVDLACSVARGELRNGLAAVRPPGHHAEADRAMGFCLLNNVAIAAQAVREQVGLERVLILDWDVHHGNGTQHSFESERDVLYFSSHQFPFYPGTGAVGEVGRDAGVGATVNVPLPAGCGDAEYLTALQRVLVPVAQAFRPELILVSCGFDSHADDPLAAMEVTGAGFAEMARLVSALANDLCDGRLVCVLEGGYALSGLEQGTRAVLDVLLSADSSAAPAEQALASASPIERVIDQVAAAHAGRFPGLRAS